MTNLVATRILTLKLPPSCQEGQIAMTSNGTEDPIRRRTHLLKTWHADRLEWTRHVRQSLAVANSGAAVAATAFIGTTREDGTPFWAHLALVVFVAGVLVLVFYGIRRMKQVEDYVREVKADQRAVQRDRENPPTRKQINEGYNANVLSLALFLLGLFFGMIALRY